MWFGSIVFLIVFWAYTAVLKIVPWTVMDLPKKVLKNLVRNVVLVQ
jgi:hypothetical protein